MRGTIGSMRAAAGLAAALAGSAFAQAQPFLVVQRAPAGEFVVDERDQAFARALAMLPDRMREIPREAQDMPPEVRQAWPGLATLIERTLGDAGHLSITYNANNPAGGLFGYGIAGEVYVGDAGTAAGMHQTITGLLGEARVPGELKASQRFAGMTDLQLPFGLASFGPSGGNYAMAIGSVDDVRVGLDSLPTSPEGIDPVMLIHLDFKGLNAAAAMARGFGGDNPGLGIVLESLESAGLLGANAMSIDVVSGYSPTHSVTLTQMNGIREFADDLGIPTEPLPERVLSAVPASAVMGSISSFDFEPVLGIIDALRESGTPVDDLLGEFERQTGVNIEGDILGALGGQLAVYTSDATGGGGLTSLVGLITYTDRERFLGAHEKLVEIVNGAIESETDFGRYIKIESWEHQGQTYMGVRSHGFPLPIEITYAATEDWLVVGMTPQAVVAAVAQTQGRGDAGIAAVPEIRDAIGEQQPISVSFMNTRRLAYSGYPLLSFLGSAVANTARSPFDDRDPGMIVPTFAELTGDVRPMIEINYWDGENLVNRVTGDRSILVQTAGMAGAAVQISPIIAAVALPAIAQARQFSLDGDVLPVLAEYAPKLLHLDPLERALLAALFAPEASELAAPLGGR